MKKIILLMFLLNLSVVYGQQSHNHRVSFDNKDGFSGYVTFKTIYPISSPEQITANSGVVHIVTYHNATSEEIEVLKKAGIDFTSATPPYKPEIFAFEVVGRAHIVSPGVHLAINDSKLSISNKLGDLTHPDFDESTRRVISEQNKRGGDYWKKFAGFSAEKVTALYLSDLKNEIDKILAEYNKGKRAFEAHISRGTSSANNFDFESAADALSDAKEASNKSNDHNSKIKALEQLIAAKKKEAEQKEKEAKELAEKEEAERKEKEAKESGKSDSETSDSATLKVKSASGKDSSKEEEKEEESKSEKKSSSKTYVPKTATQMHAEMKKLAAENPHLNNDPKFRQRLRYLEVDANREQQTLREYRAGNYNHTNYQAMASQIATNQRLDTYEKAVGDVTDAVQGLVGSIISEQKRKEDERWLQRQAKTNSYNEKSNALRIYHESLKDDNLDYFRKISRELEAKYDFVDSHINEPIIIDTETDDEERVQEFRKIKKEVGYINAFVIGEKTDEGEKYGLTTHNGNIVYPPQFEALIPYKDDNSRLSFIVNINDKWGELDGYGRIIEEIKYDGLWYTVDGLKVALKDNQWILVDKRGKTERYSTNDLKGKQIILKHLNQKGYGSGNGFPYLLDFEKGFYSSRLSSSDKVSKKLLTYELNSKESESKKEVHVYNSSYLFHKENIWYRLDIQREAKVTSPLEYVPEYETTAYTLSKMPETFTIVANDRFMEGKKGNLLWGAINQNNEVIIPFEHEYLNDFLNGKALSDKGVYDETGKLIITLANSYTHLSNFEGGYAMFYNKERISIEYGLIDEQGNEIVKESTTSPKDIDFIWHNLGFKLSKDTNPNKNLELAIYCYSRDPISSSTYFYSNYYAGNILYYEGGENFYRQAFSHFLKAAKSNAWEAVIRTPSEDVILSGTTTGISYGNVNDGINNYHTKYDLTECYLDVLHTLGFMYFRGQGTEMSQQAANEYFKKLILEGNKAISTYKGVNIYSKFIDVSNSYYLIGNAYEHLGDIKQANKHYTLAKKFKGAKAFVVENANKRLTAIKEGMNYTY